MGHKQQQELDVFREFAKVCALPLQASNARNCEPPEPDILCELESGKKLAFELVSVEDMTSNGSVSRVGNDYLAQTKALEIAYKAALTENRIVSPERFEFHKVRVVFQDRTSLIGRQRAMPRVVELLNDLGPGKHTIKEAKEKVIRSIRCEPYTECSYAGPMFYAGSTSCTVEHSTVENIKEKIEEKNYDPSHKIHLLAWSETASVPGAAFWENDLETLLADGTGQFERIWVYGRNVRAIVFDSCGDNYK